MGRMRVRGHAYVRDQSRVVPERVTGRVGERHVVVVVVVETLRREEKRLGRGDRGRKCCCPRCTISN